MIAECRSSPASLVVMLIAVNPAARSISRYRAGERGIPQPVRCWSNHRLRLGLSVVCGLVFGGRLGGGHPAANATVRSPRPTDAKRPKSDTTRKQKATGHNGQFIARTDT